MDSNDLRKWIVDYDIINRATQEFWTSFRDFMNEKWTENNPFALFNEDKLILDVREVSLKLREYSKLPQFISHEVVEVQLGLHYLGSYTGRYSISYDLSGNEVDNELEWGLVFAAINQRLSILNDLKSELISHLDMDAANRSSLEAAINIINDKQEEIRDAFKGKWKMSDDGLFISHIR